jgi:hypothetical protein
MTNNQVRRFKAALCLSALLLLVLGARAQGSKHGLALGLKLNGGMGFLLDGGGDLENFRLATVDYNLARGRLPYYTGHAKWDKVPTLPAIEGEFIFQIGRSFGIGVGSGYITYRSRGEYGYDINQTQLVGTATYIAQGMVNNTSDYQLTAVPIKLSFYGFIPSGRWNLYGRAGLGYYFGHLKNDMTSDATLYEQLLSPTQPDVGGDITARSEGTEDSRRNAFGIHGGLGVEYRLGSVSFGLECFGRWAEFVGWSGDFSRSIAMRMRTWKEGIGWLPEQNINTTDSGSGKLYYYESLDSDLDRYYGQMMISEEKPFGLSIKNSREAQIDLNTLGLVFSVRFHFN